MQVFVARLQHRKDWSFLLGRCEILKCNAGMVLSFPECIVAMVHCGEAHKADTRNRYTHLDMDMCGGDPSFFLAHLTLLRWCYYHQKCQLFPRLRLRRKPPPSSPHSLSPPPPSPSILSSPFNNKYQSRNAKGRGGEVRDHVTHDSLWGLTKSSSRSRR